MKTVQDVYDVNFMKILSTVESLSKAKRKKVGALIVNQTGALEVREIGYGFNSVASSKKDTSCEGEDGKTLPDVMHAEVKAIANCALHGKSTKGAILYCTIPPCPVCCGLLIEAGIKRVIYRETYWSESNLTLLTDAGIEVIKFNEL